MSGALAPVQGLHAADGTVESRAALLLLPTLCEQQDAQLLLPTGADTRADRGRPGRGGTAPMTRLEAARERLAEAEAALRLAECRLADAQSDHDAAENRWLDAQDEVDAADGAELIAALAAAEMQDTQDAARLGGETK